MRSSTSETETRSIPFGRPWIDDSDRRAVAAVLDGPILAHGPEAAGFEQEFAAFVGDSASAVAVSSCAAALHLAYSALGVGPGDEVILPAQTHVATANTAEWAGATCVFVDCDPATGNVTAEAVRAAVTARTRAIAVVHFVGIPCDMPAIVDVAREHGLAVVEDCALAVGARLEGTHVGLFGDAGCFSFYPVKHITSAEGGMLVARDEALASRIAKLRAHGVDRSHAERAFPGMYDVPGIGLNYRMSELECALGRSQLGRIAEILARRRTNFETIAGALSAVDGVHVLDGPGNSHYCLSVLLDESRAARREEMVGRLNAGGVGTSLYYPQPVPRMTYYREKYGYDPARYPGAEAISDRSIALPVGPHLTPDDAEYVAAAAVEALRDGA